LTSEWPDRYERHWVPGGVVVTRSPVAPAFSQGVNQMSIVRVGSSTPYAAGWDHIFGGANGGRAAKRGAKKAGSKRTVSKKAATASKSGSVAAAGKSKAKAPTARAAKNKPGRAKK
jgi:hypothetical protein